jgi:hypothetical protein
VNRPEKTEYNPYFKRYIDLVELKDFQNNFTRNTKNTIQFSTIFLLKNIITNMALISVQLKKY